MTPLQQMTKTALTWLLLGSVFFSASSLAAPVFEKSATLEHVHGLKYNDARIRNKQPELVRYHYDAADAPAQFIREAYKYKTHRMFWQAERSFLKALRYPMRDDYRASIYNDLGSLARHMRRYSRAQAYYRKALNLQPAHLDYYHNWLSTLKAIMNPEDIEQALQDWQAEAPDDIVPRYALTLVLEDAERFSEASLVLDSVLSDFPYSPLADVARLRKKIVSERLQVLAKPQVTTIE